MLPNKLIIAAAIRNNAMYLPAIFANIKIISSLFSEVKCIFVESDSSDNSLELLNTFKDNNEKVEIISLGHLEPTMPLRTQRIATARNVYLERTESLKEVYDTLLVLDTDEVNAEPIDAESILSNFKYYGWDMICANQGYLYYDLWALRHPDWMPFDCWERIQNQPSFMSPQAAQQLFLNSRFIHIDQNHPPIKVESAFGGSAFIRINSIKGIRHHGIQHGMQICEWVPFCKGLNEGNANIFINPRFINQKNIPGLFYSLGMIK